MPSFKLSWKWIILEVVLIIGSVYIANLLESKSSERSRKKDAVDALSQMKEELIQDKADLLEVIEEQKNRDQDYQDLLRWFSSPNSIPNDSMQRTLDLVANSNRTMFPRSSAWKTMVSAGQLSLLGAPSLVTKLGNHYENVNPRLVYNGELYDVSLFETLINYQKNIWDPFDSTLLSSDRVEIKKFMSQIRLMHLSWNRYYIDLLEQYGKEIDQLIIVIDNYLKSR